MADRDVYKRDLFGLRTMNEQGRVTTIDDKLPHTQQIRNQTFVKE